jgi:hypothetical protein
MINITYLNEAHYAMMRYLHLQATPLNGQFTPIMFKNGIYTFLPTDTVPIRDFNLHNPTHPSKTFNLHHPKHTSTTFLQRTSTLSLHPHPRLHHYPPNNFIGIGFRERAAFEQHRARLCEGAECTHTVR